MCLSHIKEKIPYLINAEQISELNKGFSHDQKYVIDQQYLLRLFSSEKQDKRKEEFETIKTLSTYSSFVPAGIQFGTLHDINRSYMLLTYIPGQDGEEALKDLTEKEQYTAGYSSGQELKHLHQLKAPPNYPSWFSVKQKKNDRYLADFKDLDLAKSIKETIISYIRENELLMKGRPNRFQHDDFHPSNLVIHNKRFSGIIDFQRMDWGDPIHDLQKLGFFSKQVSIEFTKGIIDGYHEGKRIDESFWRLYNFYSAVHIVPALVWGKRISQNQYTFMLERSLEVMEDHDQFRCEVPKWYK
ncbi:aminoglycoside phosphotransferase family protein [Salinibacillus xinjiangensis]|uniref:Phosphotransferase n=1 Tax=Salinibacillus xinjiangensis TaxID=1229268 RepID=A0A6G1X579_9BACI|nr:aminoglycoside phosphotransferase family protein [Salinibacillus xinjiangensis]MRG86056.1 phosphotransferase [Salinibacillus xinjiangensis]